MYLQALANRAPPTSFTQAQIWDAYRQSATRTRLLPRSAWIVEKVLNGPNGVDKRHFALTDLAALPEMTAEALNRAFEREAPQLATQALADALAQANLRPDQLDALIVCTCTGYLCPGVSSHVAEKAGLRPDAYLVDIVGQGCGAAIPSLRNAAAILSAQPHAKVAVIAVEICSAAFFVDDDPGVLISACLFGDGASASIWTGQPNGGPNLRAHDFDTIHLPLDREILRFENSGGKLRNRLDRSVPAKVAESVQTLLQRSQARDLPPIAQIVSHSGGRDVLIAIEQAIPAYDLAPSREALRLFGNMSSPSVLFALENYLKDNPHPRPGDIWLTSFGAGFAAHSCRLSPS